MPSGIGSTGASTTIFLASQSATPYSRINGQLGQPSAIGEPVLEVWSLWMIRKCPLVLADSQVLTRARSVSLHILTCGPGQTSPNLTQSCLSPLLKGACTTRKKKNFFIIPAGLLVFNSDSHVTVCLARLHARRGRGGGYSSRRVSFLSYFWWLVFPQILNLAVQLVRITWRHVFTVVLQTSGNWVRTVACLKASIAL